LDVNRLRSWGVDLARDPNALATNLDEALHDAFHSSTLPGLLRFEDRNSMAFSLESRVPFLEVDLVEFVFGLPTQLLVGEDGVTKLVFREAMRGLVPDAILDRRDKIGFATPGDTWIEGLAPLVRSVLGSPGARALPLDLAVCSSMVDDVLAGRRAFDWPIWRWVNAARWLELLDLEIEAGS
jgi:asparagine synthase (glutamine-hydrolysing)